MQNMPVCGLRKLCVWLKILGSMVMSVLLFTHVMLNPGLHCISILLLFQMSCLTPMLGSILGQCMRNIDLLLQSKVPSRQALVKEPKAQVV